MKKENEWDWEPLKIQHPDLPMKYWSYNGDIFWESGWFYSVDEACLFLDSVSEFDNEEMPDRYEMIVKAVSQLLWEDQDNYDGIDIKILFFGDNGKVHIVMKEEDEEEFDISQSVWNDIRNGEFEYGLSYEVSKRTLLKKIIDNKYQILSLIAAMMFGYFFFYFWSKL